MLFISKLILVACILCTIGCNHLLYPAQRHVFVNKERLKPIPQDVYISVDKADKSSFLHAWFFPAQSKLKKGLLVHFHGNGENLTTHFLFLSWIVDYGYDYLIFDYRGYGQSSDESATQEKTVKDGEVVFNYIYETFKDVPVIAFGQSLGSNVLVRTLQELNKKNQQLLLPDFVVLDSSFLSYQQAAGSVLGQRWFLYPLKPLAYILLSDEWSAYKSTDYTPKIPALFFHGTNDGTISYKLGQKNYEAWPGLKAFITQEGGGHTSAFGDQRFLKNRGLLLTCIDYAVNKKEVFEQCVN